MAKRPARGGSRNPYWILAGQAVSFLGDYIAIVALPLFILDLTGSALDLGFTAAFETLPTVLFGFAVGVILDRVALRRALIIADVGRAALFGVLALAIASGAAEVWMVFAVAFLVGTLAVGFDSGLQAWVPSLVPEGRLVWINSRLAMARAAAWSVGPPLAGFLAESEGGLGLAFGIDAATFAVSAVFILLLVEIRPRTAAEREPLWQSFTTGIRYLMREPRLRTATFGAMVANMLFVPMEALLALFAADYLGITEGSLFGWFVAGHSLIGMLGLLAAPRMARLIGLGRTFVLGLALLGGGFLLLAVVSDGVAALPPAAAALTAAIPAGLSVAGVSLTNMAFFTLRQQIPPEHLLGRVIAASRTLAWAGLPVGAMLGGIVGDAFGARAVYLAATLALLAVAAGLATTALFHRAPEPEAEAAS